VPKGAENLIVISFDFTYKERTSKIQKAYNKARGARFEFGESG
jgi:hypothetical protein